MPSALPVPTAKSDDILQKTLRNALLPPLLAVGFLMFLLVHQVLDMRAASGEVARTDRALAQADRTLRILIDMETGQRGFLIGGDPQFLQPYTSGERHIQAAFADLNQLVNTPDAQRQIVSLMSLQARWQQGVAREIALRRKGSLSGITTRSLRGSKAQMDEVRKRFDRLIELLQSQRETRSRNVEQATGWLFTVGTGAALGTGALLSAITFQQLRALSNHYHRLVRDERETREYLATTLRSIGDAVLVTDSSGRITLMNTVAETLTGWRADDAVGKPHETIFEIYETETGDKLTSPVEWVLQNRQTTLLENPTVLRRRNGQEIPVEDSAAPIFGNAGDLLGVALVFRDITERKAKESQLARLVEKDRRIAEILQRSMLLTPSDKAFPGVSLAFHYEAAWDEAQVGGDFHDAFALADGKVALIVGDVTGKGLEAAAYTAEIKYVLRAYLRENADPAVGLTRLNQFLIEADRLGERGNGQAINASPNISNRKMAAVALAVMDTETGRTLCAAAGAESPIVVWADGRAEELSVTGSVAGMNPDAVYDLITVHLAPGDLLIFTSDGVTEARSSRQHFFGPEGIIAAVREMPSLGTTPAQAALDALASHIAASARSFAGGKLRDDLCLLIAARHDG